MTKASVLIVTYSLVVFVALLVAPQHPATFFLVAPPAFMASGVLLWVWAVETRRSRTPARFVQDGLPGASRTCTPPRAIEGRCEAHGGPVR